MRSKQQENINNTLHSASHLQFSNELHHHLSPTNHGLYPAVSLILSSPLSPPRSLTRPLTNIQQPPVRPSFIGPTIGPEQIGISVVVPAYQEGGGEGLSVSSRWRPWTRPSGISPGCVHPSFSRYSSCLGIDWPSKRDAHRLSMWTG